MNKHLSSGKCEPCNGNTSKLDFQEISKFLSELNEWSVNDNQEMIFKKYKFSNFNKAISFAKHVIKFALLKVDELTLATFAKSTLTWLAIEELPPLPTI